MRRLGREKKTQRTRKEIFFLTVQQTKGKGVRRRGEEKKGEGEWFLGGGDRAKKPQERKGPTFQRKLRRAQGGQKDPGGGSG